MTESDSRSHGDSGGSLRKSAERQALKASEREVLSELVLERPEIDIEMFLNHQKMVRVRIGKMASYFRFEGHKKLLWGHRRDKVEGSEEPTVEDIDDERKQVDIRIDMYPETRRKKIDIGITNLKVFLQPYFILMIGHFFKEGQPVYNPSSFDKPNVYNLDVEDASEISCKIRLEDGLICINTET